MDDQMKAALSEYGRTIKGHGWDSGEPLIARGEARWPEFRKWAYALGVMLRAEELLRETEVS